MIRLTEAETKDWLRDCGLPVPWGLAARSLDEVRASCTSHPGPAVVKAMVATGRRGKAGAVVLTGDDGERAAAAARLLGSTVNAYLTEAVYIEERIAIEAEYYFAVLLDGEAPEVLLSCRGGVEIEQVSQDEPDAVVRARIDPLKGLSSWDAAELWLRAGAQGAALARLADVSSRLYAAFCKADALMLEINPLALDAQGKVQLVGAMMGVDPAALPRHRAWRDSGDALPANPREAAVVLANRAVDAGEGQYVELAGNIGLLVGGGGAGLIAFNFAQMARTDIRVRTLVELLDEKKMDTNRLPIVIRLFGAGEEQSRQMVAGRPNIQYLPRGTTLKEAAQMIVRLTAQANA